MAALAAGIGIGLFLAGAIIAAWWYFDARYQPVQLSADEEFVALIEDAPYVALNDGERPVYVIGPRELPMVESWLGEDARRLDMMGREVRAIMIPTRHADHAEEATIAQLWLRPDYRLLSDWFERGAELWTGAGLPSVRRDSARQEALSRANGFAKRMSELTGSDGRWPLLVWRDPTGALSLCICDNPQSQARARSILGIDRIGFEDSELYRDDTHDQGSSYDEDEERNLYPYPQTFDQRSYEDEDEDRGSSDMGGIEGETIPPRRAFVPPPILPGDAIYPPDRERRAAPVDPEQREAPRRETAPSQAAPQSRPPRKTAPTAPPEAKKDAESLFY